MIWLLRLNGRGIELPSAIPVAFQKYLTSNQYPYQSSEPMQLRLNDQTFMTDLEFKKQYSSIESRFREIQPKNAEHFEEYSKNNTQILERARKEARDLKLQVENIRLLKKLISSDNENLRAEAEDLKRIVQSSNVSKDVRNFLEDAKSKQENSTRKITAAFLGASNFVRDSKEKDQLMAAVRDENTRLLHNNEQLMRKNKDLEDQQLNSNFNTVPKEVVVTAPTKNIDLDSGNQAPVNQAPQQVSLQAKEPSEEEDDFFGDNDAHRNTNPVVHQNDDDEFFLDKTEAPANNNAAFSEPFDPTKRDDLNLPQQPGAYTKAEDLIVSPLLLRQPTHP
jgi:hypothetical protein